MQKTLHNKRFMQSKSIGHSLLFTAHLLVESITLNISLFFNDIHNVFFYVKSFAAIILSWNLFKFLLDIFTYLFTLIFTWNIYLNCLIHYLKMEIQFFPC